MPGYLRPTPDITLDQSYFDPVQKLRVSQPESLIDTDFEYSNQLSKWENLGLLNNRPFAYQSSNQIPSISTIELPLNSSVVTVTTTSPHGLVVGTPISVQDTFLSIANGNFIIGSVTSTTFSYNARSINRDSSVTSLIDVNKTAIYSATPFTSSRIGLAPASMAYDGREITVVTSVPHGLSLGSEVAVSGVTSTSNPPNGSWTASRIVNATTFIYYATSIPTGTLGKDNAVINVRPQAQFLHRPFDGGVLFSANASSNNQQAIRQTRKYFRYQSGKGLQISSGTTLKPNLPIERMARNGATVTVQTKDQHNIQPGSTIKILGAEEEVFNGIFNNINVTGYNTFTYTVSGSPTGTEIASGEYYVTIENWYGCSNRLGMFDSQNGMFFEFDGQTFYAVVRNSTFQLSGKISVTQGSNTISETASAFPTNFSNQLEPGDFIVIRGQSYRVETIGSNTSMTITPSYRGASAEYVQVSKTVDKKIPQSEWNLDTMDGDGPSGYNVDLTKMQMFYIDYSWYGAGFIRFGFRGVDGLVTYCHKIVNNNVNSEAYMRSGNLPARYETNTFQKITKITNNIEIADTTINVVSTEGFAPSGTLLIRGGTAFEYVNYTGQNEQKTQFTGVTRAKSGATRAVTIATGSNIGTVTEISGIQVGQRVVSPSFPENTYVSEITEAVSPSTIATVKFSTAATATDPTGVIFVPMGSTTGLAFANIETQPVSVEPAFPTYSASISHWGTAVIMDGTFDDDRSLIYTFSQSEKKTIPASKTLAGRTGTGTLGQDTIVISNATDVVTGMSITAAGIIQPNTVIRDVNGTTLTLSRPLIANMPALTGVGLVGGNTKALFSIRLAPSVDNGISANFGQRELINRMQLQLDSIGVLTSTPSSSLVVTVIINGVPSSFTQWTSTTKNSTVVANSSLAQIADYAGNENNTIILGGEQTGGFYVQGTSAIDLSAIRELGNSILGGGNSTARTSIYPDGPDVLSIVVTNLNATESVDVFGRLGWFEAQA
jgi:hypothetical protein